MPLRRAEGAGPGHTLADAFASLSDEGNFYLCGTLTARHNGEILAQRQWDVTLERDLI